MNDEGFLHELQTQPNDRITRLVYADWLDERDDPRGEFLRVELRLENLELRLDLPRLDLEWKALRLRLRALRESIDIEWLARLDRAPIENCVRCWGSPLLEPPADPYFCGPQRWERLRPTEAALVRFCDTCGKPVHYCGTVEKGLEHVRTGHCVAVDSRLARTPGDLLSGSASFESLLAEMRALGLNVGLTPDP